MKKTIFAVLSLVCGLLGFNLIAVAQSMAYMQIRNYSKEMPDLDPAMFAITFGYKAIALGLGVLSLLFCILYARSTETEARLFNSLGGILGLVSVFLALVPIYLWLI